MLFSTSKVFGDLLLEVRDRVQIKPGEQKVSSSVDKLKRKIDSIESKNIVFT
jgi:hypothetical protein